MNKGLLFVFVHVYILRTGYWPVRFTILFGHRILAVVMYRRGKFIMEKYSIKQCVSIVKTLYQNQSSIIVKKS